MMKYYEVREDRLKRIMEKDLTVNVRDWELASMAEEIVFLRRQRDSSAKVRHMKEALENCLNYFKGKASYSIPQLKHFCTHGLGVDDRE